MVLTQETSRPRYKGALGGCVIKAGDKAIWATDFDNVECTVSGILENATFSFYEHYVGLVRVKVGTGAEYSVSPKSLKKA